MERLKMAVLYGADAVYLAGTDFGMRAFAGNFPAEQLPASGGLCPQPWCPSALYHQYDATER
ncbi:MAG: hypothetical protein V8R75_10785 [Oscillospiraceae bacterium]